MPSLSEIGSLVYNNPSWALRNPDLVIRGTSKAVSNAVSPKQDDAASRGDYAGNGSASQMDVMVRTYSDSHEESQRNMKAMHEKSKNGWK